MDVAATIEQLRNEVGDIDFLRQKYAEERDKRLRPEGEAQYLQAVGQYAHYVTEDPYAPEVEPRDPITDEIDVAILGGGFSGMFAAARLRERGVDDIRIIEAGGDFGGTWYWNRYPGAQCDIESYCYLPLLEETGYTPKEKYSYAAEIYEHAQRVGKYYDLYDAACFQTRILSLDWDEELARWIVRTDRGDEIRARFVIASTGSAHLAKLPDIPGLDEFAGRSFHTSRWDYNYTGGDSFGNMHKLADKKVAVIGTGATGVQVISRVGDCAEHLYVFQRTPTYVGVRGNKPTDPEWAAGLKPGWQRERRENFDEIYGGGHVEIDLVDDSWTDIFREIQVPVAPGGGAPKGTAAEIGLLAELLDYRKMNQMRARVEAEVKDPSTAEKLKPWYNLFCKRPTFNDNYLPTFNRPNVTLVDTSGSKGVERITEKGVVANGIEYEVDLIVFATGFEIGTALHRRKDFTIVGQNNTSLHEHWSEGMRTLHGHSTRGFPNWFYMGMGQNAISPNMTQMYDNQAEQIAYIIDEVMRRGARSCQPTAEAEQGWVDEIRRLSGGAKEFLRACTPGVQNNEGRVDQPGSLVGDAYAGGVNTFYDILREWREKGDLEGLELRT